MLHLLSFTKHLEQLLAQLIQFSPAVISNHLQLWLIIYFQDKKRVGQDAFETIAATSLGMLLES